MEKLNQLLSIIKESQRIVFFGGAGVSVASNIPDFRGANGLYNYTPEEIISHSFFMSHTDKFFDFYFDKMVYKDAKPSKCHLALSKLEEKGILKAIVTQNIDGLHQMAGSKNVIELHGSVHRNYCMKCHKFYDLKDIPTSGIPKCSCSGIIKPDVVLYEENLDEKNIERAITEIATADTLIVAGTSLVVYPAASFIRYFRGKNLVYINLGIDKEKFRAQKNVLFIDGKVEDYINIENLKGGNIL